MSDAAVNDRATEGARILAAAVALQPAIRAAHHEIDQQRTLPPAVVAGMRDAGVFRMSLARELGGPELDVVQQFEVIEAISRADGSAGWCAYINSTSGFFTACIDRDVAREMYSDPDLATGGRPVPIGRAEQVEGGYVIKGRWNFASGAMHADWLVFGCVVHVNGTPQETEDGKPITITAFVDSDQFQVIDTWQAMGLRGSGSHDVEVDDVFAPEDRTFNALTSEIKRSGALFQLRTMYFFNHAAVATGIARAALDVFAEIALTKKTLWGPLHELDAARSALAEAEGKLRAARAYCLETLRDITATLERGEELTLDQRAHYRLAITHTHRACTEAVDSIFLNAGTSSTVLVPSVLERCWRDLHVANQHIIAHPQTLVEIGGMLMGIPSLDPLF